MMIRLALLLAVAAPPATSVATTPPVPPTTVPREDLVKVAIDTSEGRIVLALDRGRAPITTGNFLRYVDSHRYDGQTFYRAMPYGTGGLIQAGITTDARLLYPPIAHEPTSATGLHNLKGTVSMARLNPGSARSDFFIMTTDIPAFDAGPPGTDPGFAAFGQVVEGMDVVEKIFHDPVSATKGTGPMKGQMLQPAVKIVKAARLAR